MNGLDYNRVVEIFKEKGFTNIKLEKIEDLITGWVTKEGEVEKVTVNGDENYAPDKWVDASVEVVIYYHTFPNKDNGSSSTKRILHFSICFLLIKRHRQHRAKSVFVSKFCFSAALFHIRYNLL